mmetsp:Transcript_22145/g.28879  ORF Transcript_22145/g.28879 Transcript_22145/m.28879 type:complete len:270 (-) Transcript_22145:412-1221(-)
MPSSQYYGVNWNADRNQWQAQVRIKSGTKQSFLGRFQSEIEAAKAVDQFIINNEAYHLSLNIGHEYSEDITKKKFKCCNQTIHKDDMSNQQAKQTPLDESVSKSIPLMNARGVKVQGSTSITSLNVIQKDIKNGSSSLKKAKNNKDDKVKKLRKKKDVVAIPKKKLKKNDAKENVSPLPISEYEQLRLDNIARNKKVLSNLGLHDSSLLTSQKQKPTSNKVAKTHKNKSNKWSCHMVINKPFFQFFLRTFFFSFFSLFTYEFSMFSVLI